MIHAFTLELIRSPKFSAHKRIAPISHDPLTIPRSKNVDQWSCAFPGLRLAVSSSKALLVVFQPDFSRWPVLLHFVSSCSFARLFTSCGLVTDGQAGFWPRLVLK